MNGLENSTYVIMLLFSNMVAILLLVTALKLPRLARLFFSVLFLWAGWTNWQTALNNPNAYLEYGRLAFFDFYKNFINGWFKSHIIFTVGFVATCQLLISIGMQAKGKIFKVAALAAIFFFLAIIPLGIGSGFPCTLTLAVAMFVLFRYSPSNYLWVSTQAKLASKRPGSKSYNLK